MVIAMYANACVALPRRYGFQEASWRIAATRSLKDPRPSLDAARHEQEASAIFLGRRSESSFGKTGVLKFELHSTVQHEELYEEAVCWQHPPQHH